LKPRIVTLIQGSPDWHAWRINVIGSSRAAAIIGVSKFQTAYELWCEMTGRRPGFEGNAATAQGNAMEPAARAAYEMNEGFIECPPICVLHPTIEFIGASLDGLNLESKIPVEIKYPGAESHSMAVNGEVPHHYWVQVQHILMCLPDAPMAHYISHRVDGQAKVEVHHDLEFQKKLLEAEIAFWDLLKQDIAPPLTERDAKLVDDPEVKAICSELLSVKDKKDKASKLHADALKAKIVALGGHNRVRCGNTLVSKSQAASGKDSYRLTVSSREGG